MHPRLNEVISLTPTEIHIAEYDVEQYDAQHRELFRKGLPFTVRGFTDPNANEQLLNRFASLYGNYTVKARFNATPEEYAHNRKYKEVTLRNYINDVFYASHHEPVYAAKNIVDINILNALNIRHPYPMFAEHFRTPNCWIGPKGSTTPLHNDSTDNFSIQLLGIKRWILFSVHEIHNLSLQRTRYGNYKPASYDFQVSLRDIESLRKEVPSYEVSVPEGFLLYLPYGWAHYVENTTSSLMINCWLKPDNYVPLILTR
jgi:hypothetical protein